MNFAFKCVSGRGPPFVVLLHTEEAPSAAKWESYVVALTEMLARETGVVHVFVATDGGGPNSSQRSRLAQVVSRGATQALTHVFTDDLLVRSIVAAFRMLTRAYAIAHAPRTFASVCVEYGFTPQTVIDEFNECQRSFPPVKMLQDFEASVRASHPRAGGTPPAGP